MAAVAAPAVLVRAGGRPAPSERITLALIGCGGMGNAHLDAFLRKTEAEVVAVCDVDRERRRAAQEKVRGFYAGQAASGAWAGCAAYTDFREVLARADIDAVVIATPDHWHAAQTVLAVRAGKDVYCEKPLTHHVTEGRWLADEVARTGRVFQTGSQQRSDARFRRACELVRQGVLGRISRVVVTLPPGAETGNHPRKPVPEGFDYDLWLGPAPWAPYCDNRTHYNFRHILDYTGGKLADWGAHHIDIAQWALGRHKTGPVRVSGRGRYPSDGLWDAAVEYEFNAEYDDGVVMTVRNHPPEDGSTLGVLFEGARGRLFVTRGRAESDPASILEAGPSESGERLPVSDDHQANFLSCVRSRAEPIAPAEDAHRTITIAHLGNIAMRSGRVIRWDPDREAIVDDSGASRMLSRAPRGEWRS